MPDSPEQASQSLEEEMAAQLAHAAKVCAGVDTFTLYDAFWRASNAVCRVEISGRADDEFGPHVTFYASRGDLKWAFTTTLASVAIFKAGVSDYGWALGGRAAAEFDEKIEQRRRNINARNYPPSNPES